MRTHTKAVGVIIKFLVVGSMPMDMYGVVGLAICRHGGSKYCIPLDAEPREEFNGIKIICIALCIRKLLPRSMLNVNRL